MKIYHVYTTGSCDGSLCYGVCALSKSDAATLVQRRISSKGEVGGKITRVQQVSHDTGEWEYGTVLCYGKPINTIS